MRRRALLKLAVIGGGAFSLDPLLFSRTLAGDCAGSGPYGALLAADANGIRLPHGFSSRVVARSGSAVSGTSYVWHAAPDGGATFPTSNGGWLYVSNSEVGSGDGGASSVSFDAVGRINGARRLLGGTSRNCAGGPTRWGTWLSCEEIDRGFVYECDPLGERPAVERPALGRFTHEAAAVDAVRKAVYLTEDEPDGCFYRFRYDTPNDLSTGTLQVATILDGHVAWTNVADPEAVTTPTRHQVSGAARFNGGEGAWYGRGVVHFTTKGDNRVWRYDVESDALNVVYDVRTACNPVLTGVDNVTVARSGDVYVAEDGGNMQLVILATDGSVSPFLEITDQHGSEVTGPAFTPNGRRLYLSSQRGGPDGEGITYEISGPFRPSAFLPDDRFRVTESGPDTVH